MLGTLRNVLVIVAGVLMYGEQITVDEALGYSVALLGFAGWVGDAFGCLVSFRCLFLPAYLCVRLCMFVCVVVCVCMVVHMFMHVYA